MGYHRRRGARRPLRHGICDQRQRRYPKLPAIPIRRGAGDQLLIVVPSLKLIAVRNGTTLAPEPKNPKDVFEAYHSQRVKILFEPLVDAVVTEAAKSNDCSDSTTISSEKRATAATIIRRRSYKADGGSL